MASALNVNDIPDITTLEIFLRMSGAIVLGALIGVEREWRERSAGFRTHVMVCLGSAIFTLVSAYGFQEWLIWAAQRTDGPPTFTADPARIAAQIVSGIGFLGAGAILRSGLNIQGLTTAATLWVTSAVGMAVAIGMWELAAISTISMLVVLIAFRPIREKIAASAEDHEEPHMLSIYLTTDSKKGIKSVVKILEDAETDVNNIETGMREGIYYLKAVLNRPRGTFVLKLHSRVQNIEGLKHIEINDKLTG